jgi:hypothetical protein
LADVAGGEALIALTTEMHEDGLRNSGHP